MLLFTVILFTTLLFTGAAVDDRGLRPLGMSRLPFDLRSAARTASRNLAIVRRGRRESLTGFGLSIRRTATPDPLCEHRLSQHRNCDDEVKERAKNSHELAFKKRKPAVGAAGLYASPDYDV